MTEIIVAQASVNLSKAKLEMVILKAGSSASVSDIAIKEAEIAYLTDMCKLVVLEHERSIIQETTKVTTPTTVQSITSNRRDAPICLVPKGDEEKVPVHSGILKIHRVSLSCPETPPPVYEIVCQYCSFLVSIKESMKEAEVSYMFHLVYDCDKSIIRPQKTTGGDELSLGSSVIKEARKSITRKRRLEVWERWIGADCGIVDCPLCLTSKIKPLDGSSWNVAHVIPHCHGGTIDVDNLRVICSSCNSSMSSMDMRDYCEMYHPSAIDRLHL